MNVEFAERPHSAFVARLYGYLSLYIEPLSALSGAYYSSSEPKVYFGLTNAASGLITGVPKSTHIVLSQLSNHYIFFTHNEALALRSTSDLRVWRTLLLCLLVTDLGHLYGVKAVGTRIYWDAPH